MAAIVIQITTVQPGSSGSDIYYAGYARLDGMPLGDPGLYWNCEVAPTALATAINAAIKDAAIAAAVANSYTVGALDKKTIIGGALGV